MGSSMVMYDVDRLMEIGSVIAQSGMFQDTRGEAQAIVKVLAGQEIGVGPIAAMTGINMIKGRVTLGANLMAACIKGSGKYTYRHRRHDDEVCELEFFERTQSGWESIGVSAFTAEDATRAGTQNMHKFPRNMLFARALSNGAKWFCPDVFGGGPVYTPDELGAEVDEDGAMTVPTVTTERPAPPRSLPAAPPAPSEKERKRFHALGKELYGKEWDAKRPEFVRAATSGRATSSTELTQREMAYLIEQMDARKREADKGPRCAKCAIAIDAAQATTTVEDFGEPLCAGCEERAAIALEQAA